MSPGQRQGKQDKISLEESAGVILERMEPFKAYMTSEIAEAVGWSRHTTYRVLNALAEEGKIQDQEHAAYSGYISHPRINTKISIQCMRLSPTIWGLSDCSLSNRH